MRRLLLTALVLLTGCPPTPGTQDDAGAPPDLTATAACDNARRDGAETDVDCGGPSCGKCLIGKMCIKGEDCVTGACLNGTCIAPMTCGNGKKDGDETDTDCGGTCPTKCPDGKACSKGTDCASGACLNNLCVPMMSACGNNTKDGMETDVDCGGPMCRKCPIGKACLMGSDCESNACLNGMCIAPPNMCADRIKNGMETDADCGGPICPKCDDGKTCVLGTDCMSGACLNGACVPPPNMCNDGKKNGTETDIDCGGVTCGKCADGKACLMGTDCQTAMCLNGQCVAKTANCMNAMKDGDETDVDCGGMTCRSCLNGKMCLRGADCMSNTCINNLCAPPPGSCVDGMKNGSETDVDCGGAMCPKCANGKACNGGGDCTSATCANNVCQAPQPTCNDQAKNGSETDVDCGGPMCAKCINGKACFGGTDCMSGTCLNNVCQAAPPTCNDMMKNGGETDTDCGGLNCPKCVIGKMCLAGADCLSATCLNGKCEAPQASCMDMQKNGGETDIDCGGNNCPKCVNGKVCVVGADCQSGACLNGICQAQGAFCNDGQKNGQETDLDCGGPNCGKCAIGKMCLMGADCLSATCVNNICGQPMATCNDMIKNAAETDIDCGGGMCPKCVNGKTCAVGNDCNSNVCTQGICANPAACNDMIKNGAETDVDCGGGMCAKCGNGAKCGGAADCVSNSCVNGTCQAQVSCMDNVKNGMETDVDCGGNQCGKCANGKMCAIAADCSSNVCSLGTCLAPPANCMDNVKNGIETDVDCGGGQCPKCVDGRKCGIAGDCNSGVCTNFTCAAPACNDAVRNGVETDVDCGGVMCAKCGTGKICLAPSDCQSNLCTNGLCSTPSACNDGMKNGMETDLDCGGPQCPKCATNLLCMAGSDCVSNGCSNGKCTSLYSTPTPFATQTSPAGLTAFDVDGGGKIDLIVPNVITSSVSVLLGAGNGTFAAATHFKQTGGPASCSVGDFNSDGKVDIASATYSSQAVFNKSGVGLLLGSGGGNFMLETLAETTGNPQDIQVADVNSDGRFDVIAADYPNKRVNVVLGNGDGTFQAPAHFTVANNPYSVVARDLSGDGKLDLVVANFMSDSVSVLYGNGNGSFQNAINYNVGPRPKSVAVGDLNGDGKLDVVTANVSSRDVSVLLGAGGGPLGAAVQYPGVNWNLSISPRAILVTDVTADNIPDVVCAGYNDSAVMVLRGLGDGKLMAPLVYPAGQNPAGIVVADFNNDGKPDVAVTNSTTNQVSVLLNMRL